MEFSKDPNLEEFVSRFLERGRNQKVSILVVGRTGAGKSQIINSLIGWPVAKEGHTLEAQSMRVKCHRMFKNDVETLIWDSPGTGDLTENSDEEYLDQMKEVGMVNLVLFCANMNMTRVDQADLNCITKLTQAFGENLWKNAMIVLTFANQVCLPPSSSGSSRKSLVEYFCDRRLMFKETYFKTLRQIGVDVDDLILHQQLSVVTAGHMHELTLPDTDDWIQNLWMQAFKTIQHSSKPAFLYANAKRLFPASGVSERSRMERGEYSPLDETWNLEKCSSVPQKSRRPHPVSPTNRRPFVSDTVAATMELFQNVAAEPIKRNGNEIARRHTMCATQGDRSNRNKVQRLTATFEQLEISPEAPELQMRRSASLSHRQGKQSAASFNQKGTSCASEQEIRIGVGEENERGIFEVITGYFRHGLEAVNYGKAGAEAGKMIGKVFSSSLGADNGEKVGFVTGEVIYAIKSIFFKNEQASHKESEPKQNAGQHF